MGVNHVLGSLFVLTFVGWNVVFWTKPPAEKNSPCKGKQCGFTFGGGELGVPYFGYDSEESQEALTNLADTGASHVRIVVTNFMNSETATQIGPVTNIKSAIRTQTKSELKPAVAKAKELGMKIFFTPLVDLNWDNTSNKHSPWGGRTVQRSNIGRGFGNSQWNLWFQSYTDLVVGYAKFAEEQGIEQFSVAFGLENAIRQAPEEKWVSLVSSVKEVYSGKLTVDTEDLNRLPAYWYKLVDALGSIASKFSGPHTRTHNGTVEQLEEAWGTYTTHLQQISKKAGGKLILVSEIGYQSRPDCHKAPAGIKRKDGKDCSGWLECYDHVCQERAVEAFMRIAIKEDVILGVYWWLWRNDPTAGGTCSDDFTVFAKPAEAVIRKYFGGEEKDTTATCAAAIRKQNRKAIQTPFPAPPELPVTRKKFNGYVFGGPDEWSSPYHRYGSPGSLLSLDMLVEIGANAVELPAMWYYINADTPDLYPKTDVNSSLLSTTVEEMGIMIKAAKARNLTVAVTPMIDPDYDLPGNCRQCAGGPGWRGEVGRSWGNQCGPGTRWDKWFKRYTEFIMMYAKVSQEAGADEFIVSHELQLAVQRCSANWSKLVREVRKVFTRVVAAAYNVPIYYLYHNVGWIGEIDYVGVDCFFNIPVQYPKNPWADAAPEAVKEGWRGAVSGMRRMAKDLNTTVRCTETGVQSRPWDYSGNWRGEDSTNQLDPHDCSVWDMCFSPNAQEVGYDGMLSALYNEDWYRGFYLWLWRADPTAGGPTDDTFTGNGKAGSIRVLQKFWGQVEG